MGRKKSNDRLMVDVKVSPALREYILSVNGGSDIIHPMKGSRLWGLVKMHLVTIPNDYRPTPPEGYPDCIRIALFNSHRTSWSEAEKSVIVLHTLYRDYLSEEGQRAVARHLMQGFKQTFRAYMTGTLSNNPEMDITDAIDEFCSDYHIPCEKITLDMLRKDWYRFRQRCSKDGGAPVEYSDF